MQTYQVINGSDGNKALQVTQTADPVVFIIDLPTLQSQLISIQNNITSLQAQAAEINTKITALSA